jgi:hypothetical protein
MKTGSWVLSIIQNMRFAYLIKHSSCHLETILSRHSYPCTGHNSFRFETPHLLASFILRPPANLIKHRAVEGNFALKLPIISFES